MFLKKPLLYALLASTFCWPQAVFAQQKVVTSDCDPIGRVLKSQNKNLVGALLCRGRQLSLIQSSSILCFLTNSITPAGNVGKCAKPEAIKGSKIHLCDYPNQGLCIRDKGTGTAQAPRIIKPYSRMILDQHPQFVWQAIPGVTNYQVQIESQSQNLWTKTISGTTTQYPQSLPPLNSNDIYKVSVLAFKGSIPFTSDYRIFQILDSEKSKELKQLNQLIHSFNLDADQKAYLDLNALYLSQGLVQESIQALEDRIKAGSDHPEVYRVLGDRFWDVSLVDRAYDNYQKAAQLAKTQGNESAFNKAMASLKRIEELQSQPPDSKKGDQK